MDTVVPRLHASTPEPLGFGTSLQIRAFLLERERGNLLVYRSANLEQDAEAVRDLGGISRQYLNHHSEASPACDWVARTFGAPLHIHEADALSAAKVCEVGATFSGRHRLGRDFEVVPVPGHSGGATAYLWDTGEHRALFTGDTIFFGQRGWRAAVPDGVGEREKYVESLNTIRSLEFDLLVPAFAAEGEPYYEFVEKVEAERQIDEILRRVRRGGSG